MTRGTRESPNSVRCPVCGSRCRTVRTRDLTPRFREITFACTNEPCGEIFVSSVQPVRTIHPSALPADSPERVGDEA